MTQQCWVLLLTAAAKYILFPNKVSPVLSSSDHTKTMYNNLKPWCLVFCSFILHCFQDPFQFGWCSSFVASWLWEWSSFCSTSFPDLFKSSYSILSLSPGKGWWSLFTSSQDLLLTIGPQSTLAVLNVKSKTPTTAAPQFPAQPKALWALSVNSWHGTLMLCPISCYSGLFFSDL